MYNITYDPFSNTIKFINNKNRQLYCYNKINKSTLTLYYSEFDFVCHEYYLDMVEIIEYILKHIGKYIEFNFYDKNDWEFKFKITDAELLLKLL